MDLDTFDRAILDLVQENNQLTHAQIGERVNLSASSVRRRLTAMRQAGVIIADVALTDAAQQGLSFIVHISFEQETREVYEAFRAQMNADLAVSQCYDVSGDFDFVLIVHAVSPEAYKAWGESNLMQNEAIRRYSTSLVWKRSKFTTKVAPAELPEPL